VSEILIESSSRSHPLRRIFIAVRFEILSQFRALSDAKKSALRQVKPNRRASTVAQRLNSAKCKQGSSKRSGKLTSKFHFLPLAKSGI